MRNRIVIFDRDGTCADCTTRVKRYLSNDPKQWETFFLASINDAPILPIVNLAYIFREQGFSLYLWTGMPDRHRDTLDRWLTEYDLTIFEEIRMRPDKNFDKDFVLKKNFLDAMPISDRQNIFLALDNDREVCDMYDRAAIQSLLVI